MAVEIVCELGINMNGDLDTAKRLIDVAHQSGADFVKFQKRTIESCYTKEELDTPRESPWGTTTREQKEGLELTVEEYQKINMYCRDKISWFASPWDLKSIFLIRQLGSRFLKVPSALITNLLYLEACKTADLPIILSTGMSTLEMIDKAVDVIGWKRIYAILHCTSTYPSTEDELNLRCISEFKHRYPWAKIGYSNHHPGVIFPAAVVALGAEMVELHVTLDKTLYGSDQAASFNPDGVMKVVKYIRDIEAALGDGKKKIYDSELPIMLKLRKE